jgi:hypothetical protein
LRRRAWAYMAPAYRLQRHSTLQQLLRLGALLRFEDDMRKASLDTKIITASSSNIKIILGV